METKKKSEFEINARRPLHLFMAFSCSLLLVISAFEWKSEFTKLEIVSENVEETINVFEMPQTKHEVPLPKPKPVVIDPVVIESNEEIKEVISVFSSDEPPFNPDSLPDYDVPVEITKEPDFEDIVESMPTPHNGYEAFYAFVSKNMKYPKAAIKQGIHGKVYIRFIVGKDGQLRDFEVIKGIGGGCDEEAIRVLTKSPKWNAGKQRGRPVNVRMVMPFNFEMNY